MLSKEELIEELYRLEEELGKEPTSAEMDEKGKFSHASYNNHFGSWNDALEEVGFGINKRGPVEKEEIISDIHTVVEELGRPPTLDEMYELGSFGKSTYERASESWNGLLREAGYEPHKRDGIPDSELLNELSRLNDELGRVPSQNDMDEYGEFGFPTYVKRFGSWSKAQEEAGLTPNEPYSPSGERNGRWVGWSPEYYGPNWREQRRRCRERDNHQCQCCGKTNEDLGREPDVHHIIPIREFRDEEDDLDYEEANRLGNLVMLCHYCHRSLEGKYTSLTANDFQKVARLEA